MEPGRRIGNYEILGPLGSGGMGAVYRARDHELDRDVAIKILSQDSGDDPTVLARFKREAKLLAATNHPNIATIYGVEKSDDGPCLVMEVVEGDTLADRLRSGPLPAEEALRVCAQIARGVGAAHAQGIVHRDLKPANVVVLADGTVKLLDFGIAKSLATAPPQRDHPTAMTTVSPELTAVGAVVGTAPYMSPEQVRGQAVDERCDIWAFGCILYEALAGKRAFAADTQADTLSAVLEHEPDWEALPDSTPPSALRLLAHALHKDANQRLHSIADARIEIDRTLADMERPDTGNTASTLPTETRLSTSTSTRLVRATIALLAILGTVAAATWLWAPSAPAVPVLGEIRRVTSLPGQETGPVFSPDGSTVAFSSTASGNRDIWLKRIDGGDAAQFTTHPAEDDEPDFSPDGTWIVFHSRRDGGGIFAKPAPYGGDVVRVADFGFRPRWSPDGSRIIFQQRRSSLVPNEIYVVDFPVTGAPQTLIPFVEGGDPSNMGQWSPDGQFVAAFHGGYRRQPGGWSLFPVDGGPRSDLEWEGQGLYGMDLAWMADGSGVILGTAGDLAFAPIDRTGRMAGPASRLVADAVQGQISADGKLIVYGDVQFQDDIWRVALDPLTGLVAGRPERITEDRASDRSPLYLPVHERLVFLSDRSGEMHLYSSDLEGGDVRLLAGGRTWGAGGSFYSASPDGRWITYQASTQGRRDSLFLPIDAATGHAGVPTRLRDMETPSTLQLPGNWAPDSRRIGFWTRSLSEAGLLAFVEEPWSESARVSHVDLGPEFRARFPKTSSLTFSPDGRWMLFAAYRERHRPFVFVLRVGTTDPIPIFEGAGYYGWTTDPRRIIVYSERGDASGERLGLIEIDVNTGSVVRDLTPLDLQATQHGEVPLRSNRWTMTPDGRWLYFQFTELEGDIYVADLVWPRN